MPLDDNQRQLILQAVLAEYNQLKQEALHKMDKFYQVYSIYLPANAAILALSASSGLYDLIFVTPFLVRSPS